MLDAVYGAEPSDPAAPPLAPGARPLVFSSFDPDVCVELMRRQRRFPVYFLSTCGSDAHADPRRQSIAAALDVASGASMAGVVVPAAVVMAHEDMVGRAARPSSPRLCVSVL